MWALGPLGAWPQAKSNGSQMSLPLAIPNPPRSFSAGASHNVLARLITLGFGWGGVPGCGDRFVLVIQASRNANFANADKLFVIFLDFIRQVAIVDRDPERSLKSVGAQISKYIYSLEARAIGEVKRCDGVIEFAVAVRAREVGKSEAAKRFR